MYILRHPKQGLAPLSVARAPGGSGKLNLIATDGTDGAVLRDGSDCIVLHVSGAPVELLVTAFLAQAGDAIPPLRVDQIALDPAPSAQPASGARPIAIGAQGISLIGHIERTGDVVAGLGQVLGEPASDLRLEGFQAMWPDRPDGVDLAYGITVEGAGAMPIVKTGKFCGTKGQARRITEVTFALVGPQAPRYAIEGTAYFTGGFQLPVSSGIALSGPSGLEHLTALSLRAVPAAAQAGNDNPWQESPRTQVFKADSPAAPKAGARKKPAVTKAGAKKQA
jgi:hypothetical protein